MLKEHAPAASARMLHALQDSPSDSPPSDAAAQHASACLSARGYAVPNWHAAWAPPDTASRGDQPSDYLRGWLPTPTHDDVGPTCSLPLPSAAQAALAFASRTHVWAALGCLVRPPGGMRYSRGLASRAIPLAIPGARPGMQGEAGARVAQNVRLADMNLDVPIQDARRIEVVCNGLPLWHGEQLAVDATIVNPVGRDGQQRAGASTV